MTELYHPRRRSALPKRARNRLRHLRSIAMTGALTFALAVVEMVTGCDTTTEDEDSSVSPASDVLADASTGQGDAAVDALGDVPQTSDTGPVVYYGPQPVDALGDVPQTTDTGTAVYYGPAFIDTLDDVPQTTDAGPVVYYGPQPVDALGDVPQTSDTGPVVYYGPQPVDALGDIPQTSDTGPVVYYGPQPVDAGPTDIVDQDCPPMAFYGPPPCTDDADCEQWYGSGWYCKKDNVITPPCGDPFNFATCEPKP